MKSRFLRLGLVAWLAAAAAPWSLAQGLTGDLTTAGSSAWLNGAWFQQIPGGSTGTGNIDPFLRLQNTGNQQGFNTDAKSVLDNKDGAWTRSVLLSSVPTVNINGSSYYQVLLDINESGSQPLLALTGLAVYQTSNPNLTRLGDLPQSAMKWSLDTQGADRTVLLNYALNSGSGYGDMYAYLPTSTFNPNDSANPYFVLYSSFGQSDGGLNASESGFEEWALTTAVPVPEPGTISLMALGLAAVGAARRRRRQRERAQQAQA